jgi:hypothetical protein
MTLRWLQISMLAPVALAGGTVGGNAAWAASRDAVLQFSQSGYGVAPLVADLCGGGFAMTLLILSAAQIAALVQRPAAVRSA